jgi:hypothetical protein
MRISNITFVIRFAAECQGAFAFIFPLTRVPVFGAGITARCAVDGSPFLKKKRDFSGRAWHMLARLSRGEAQQCGKGIGTKGVVLQRLRFRPPMGEVLVQARTRAAAII